MCSEVVICHSPAGAVARATVPAWSRVPRAVRGERMFRPRGVRCAGAAAVSQPVNPWSITRTRGATLSVQRVVVWSQEVLARLDLPSRYRDAAYVSKSGPSHRGRPPCAVDQPAPEGARPCLCPPSVTWHPWVARSRQVPGSGRWTTAGLCARRGTTLGARLTDLTVSGATTATILHVPQRVFGLRFPPQVSGLSPDVDLVTVTAGGNDLNYIGCVLRAAYAGRLSHRPIARRVGRRLGRGGLPRPHQAAIDAAADGLAAIVRAARTRAPHARVLLVSYLTMLEPDAPCTPDAPFTPDTRDALLAIADGLNEAFLKAAAVTGAELVDIAHLSRGHGLGGAQPWVRGFSPFHPAASFHPIHTGMQAVADAIVDHLANAGPG